MGRSHIQSDQSHDVYGFAKKATFFSGTGIQAVHFRAKYAIAIVMDGNA